MSIFIRDLNNVSFNKRALDARGSLSVSEKTTLGNYVQDRNNLPIYINRLGTSGLVNQVYDSGATAMIVPAISGEYEIAQTFSRHPYYAGKSQVSEVTFSNYQNEAGVIKRAGYYSSTIVAPYDSVFDGVWFESDGTDYKFAIGNANTGLVTYITQANWNIDKLDGTGPSGVTQDFTNFQVLVIDFLYLGGTAVRFGFKDGEDFNWAHAYNHANRLTGTFVASPHQPIRWEIRSTGGAGALEQICAGVHSEGTSEITGLPSSTPVPTAQVNANSVGVSYVLAGIRLKNTDSARRVNILNTTIAGLLNTNDNVVLSLVLNPTIAGSPTWATLPDDSDVEYLVADTSNNPSVQTVTGGRTLPRGFVSTRSTETNTEILSLVRRLGHSIDGTPDELILVVTPLSSGTNADAHGIINFNIY